MRFGHLEVRTHRYLSLSCCREGTQNCPICSTPHAYELNAAARRWHVLKPSLVESPASNRTRRRFAACTSDGAEFSCQRYMIHPGEAAAAACGQCPRGRHIHGRRGQLRGDQDRDNLTKAVLRGRDREPRIVGGYRVRFGHARQLKVQAARARGRGLDDRHCTGRRIRAQTRGRKDPQRNTPSIDC